MSLVSSKIRLYLIQWIWEFNSLKFTYFQSDALGLYFYHFVLRLPLLRYPYIFLSFMDSFLCLSLLWHLESCVYYCFCCLVFCLKFSYVFSNMFLCPSHQGCSEMFQFLAFLGKPFYLMVIGLYFSYLKLDVAT